MVSPLIMMALGPYVFALETAAYQRLRRSTQYRWPVIERLGRRPARQYVGHGDETIDLAGVIHPHFKGGLRQIQAMRLLARQGVPLTMIDGTGISFGLWCIERIEERQAVYLPGGVPKEQRFSLSLGRYGVDLL